MSLHKIGAGLAPFVVGAGILVACVGDTTVPPTGQPDAAADVQGGNDAPATETGTDTSVADTSVDVTPDAPVEAGICSNAQPGNTVNLPGGGNFLVSQQSTPLKAGTYALTDAYYSCFNCSVVSASAIGGLIVSIVGQTVTIQRRLDLQEQGQSLQSVADRWSGTFDQINQNLSVARQCPTVSPNTDWFANVPPTDAGKARLHVSFGNEFQVKDKTTSTQFSPTFVFTQL
jgi:hypothetical protein